MNARTKRLLSSVGAIVVAAAMLVGGTYAFQLFEHRSNTFSNEANLQARLVENFEEGEQWTLGQDLTKEISVKNVGGTDELPGDNWGGVYVRVKLREHMDISPVDYVYYPEDDDTYNTRFMVDKNGKFVRFEADELAGTEPSALEMTAIKSDEAWEDVIHDAVKRTEFLNALKTTDFVKISGLFDDDIEYWYLVTKEGDPNGQYGSFVPVAHKVSDGTLDKVTGSERATDVDYSKGLVSYANEHENEECEYPLHLWNGDGPDECTLGSHEYAKWGLGKKQNGMDAWILADVWNGEPIDRWILDLNSGWATWGQELLPTQSTELLLETITPLKNPSGMLLYVIHADMQACDETDLNNPDLWETEDGTPDPWLPVGPQKVAVQGVTLNQDSFELNPGGTAQLRANVQPAKASNKNVSWSSSDETVATVDANGKVTAVAEGTATITVTTDEGSFTADCEITVTNEEVPATEVIIGCEDNINLDIGDRMPLPDITKVPADSTETPEWTSSDPGVAYIDEDTGEIVGVAPGETEITVKLEPSGVTDSITVKVIKPADGGLTIDGGDTTMKVGDEKTFTASLLPADSNDEVVWEIVSSTPAGVIELDPETGYVTAKKKGTAVIKATAKSGGTSDEIEITVQGNYADDVTIDPPNPADLPAGVTIEDGKLVMIVGSEYTPAITKDPPGADGTITWDSSAPGTASVNATSGKITAVEEGTATITVTLEGGATDTIDVVVKKPSIPTKGEGPFQAQHHDTDDSKEFGMYAQIASMPFRVVHMENPCAVKFTDIMNVGSLPGGFDQSTITVKDAWLTADAGKTSIADDFETGLDHSGEMAILSTYVGVRDDWENEWPNYPSFQVTVVLQAPGFADTVVQMEVSISDRSMYV